MNKESFRESLRRAQNAMNKATASVQGAIDNNQEAINRLNPNNPLVQYAQGVQDIANLAAHPVKTSKAVINQAKKEVKETVKNPVGTYLKYNPASVAYNTGKEIMKQGVPRTLGQMSATSLVPVKAPVKTAVKAPVKTPVEAPVKTPVKTAVKAPVKTTTPVGNSLGGDAIKTAVKAPVKTPVEAPVKTPVKTATPVGALVKAPVKTPVKTATPVGNSLGGDAVKTPVGALVKVPVKAPAKTATPVGNSLGGDAIIVSARPQALKFQASLLEQAGVPLQKAKQDLAQSISRNSDLPNNILGSYSTITGKINVSPNTKIQQYGFSSYDVGSHETAHRILHRLEALENAGLITPKGAEFLHNLRQSQSNKLTPLYANEAVTRGFELARNPNLKFNKKTLKRLKINPSDIENAAKTISPYYRDFLKGGM